MTPSRYQKKIYDWARTGSGSARVMAVAGAGKTSTLVELSEKIDGEVIFCAFNKHIERELSSRLPTGVTCRTIHSLGLQAIKFAIGYAEVNPDKYSRICEALIADMASRYRFRKNKKTDLITGTYRIRRTLEDLSSMCMTTLTDPADHLALREMCRRYCIEIPRPQREEFFDLVPKVIKRGVDKTELGEIDYVDMLYYPASSGLKMKRHDWVLVDEAQDLSVSQLAVVMGALGPNGRMVAVGDKLQSIYGFSGADPWSFNRVGSAVKADDLPLSICYRCSRAVVELAQELVPEMECSKGAAEGSVDTISRSRFAEAVKPGDMVVCRINAPLIGACLDLVKQGKKAYVRGLDLKNSLLGIVERVVEDPDYSWDDFDSILCDHQAAVVKSHLDEEDAQGAQTAADKFDAIRVCLGESGASEEDDLKASIEDLFTEKKDSAVLSTVHRAKGLEADRVMVLHPHCLRLYWKGQRAWQAYQEQCCEYVAITRAKQDLIFVEEPDKPYNIGKRLELPEEE